jgi:hypothetical protein
MMMHSLELLLGRMDVLGVLGVLGVLSVLRMLAIMRINAFRILLSAHYPESILQISLEINI